MFSKIAWLVASLSIVFILIISTEGNVNLYSNDLRCLEAPGGMIPSAEDCLSSGSFPIPYGNELKVLWTFHSFRRKCFNFTHDGCIPRSPNWFYTKEACEEICGRYMPNGPRLNKSDTKVPSKEMSSNLTNSSSITSNTTGNSSSGDASRCDELPAFGSCVNYRRYDIFQKRWIQYPERIRYTYQTGVCRPFIWSNGDCGENRNLFVTKKSCESVCENKMPPCCQSPFLMGHQCAEDELEPDKASGSPVKRYSYNGGTCVPFRFYGCGGSKNNFKTLKSCEKACSRGENTQPRTTTRSPTWGIPTMKDSADEIYSGNKSTLLLARIRRSF